MPASGPLRLIDKVFDAHVVARRESGDALLFIDRHFVHEGSHHAFGQIAARGIKAARPDLTIGLADHYAPTRGRGGPIADPSVARMVDQLSANAATHGVALFGLDDARQGIVHVVGPEQGITLPGLTIVCGDSHTSTHGAFGAYAFGIGASEVAHVLATQTLWQKKPKAMRVRVDGALGHGVTAKDLMLHLIAAIGADGASGHAIEFDGPAIRALSMEARMTLCNMAIEAGARLGMIAPDETTYAYVRGRPFAPEGVEFDAACEAWARLCTEAGAAFERETSLDATQVAPTVTWGVSPEQATGIDALVPDPAHFADAAKAAAARDALDYMALAPGAPLKGLAVDRAFIGSCTNARIEDLRAAAAVLKGRKSRVPGIVSPGSTPVKRQAEAEGLAAIFVAAGLEWRDSGCSLCVAMNGDMAAPGERVASSTNRNFKGRQGPGARTHIMAPAMVAAAAVKGALADVREFAP